MERWLYLKQYMDKKSKTKKNKHNNEKKYKLTER